MRNRRSGSITSLEELLAPKEVEVYKCKHFFGKTKTCEKCNKTINEIWKVKNKET